MAHPQASEEGQEQVIAFLADPANHRPRPAGITRIDTHGAIVFLAGARAYKMKRAVRFPYMDFSTLDKRRAACRNEIAVNRANAPEIYIDAVPVTRDEAGRLAIDGGGNAVEWVVRMHRFDETASLDRLAEAGRLEPALLAALARQIAAAHARAPVHREFDHVRAFARIIREDAEELAGRADLFAPAEARDLVAATERALARATPLLKRRQNEGFVRHCHGDLHLRNIVRIGGEPVLFDAIEFDDSIAIVDVLYDLAFLLMDLEQRGLRDGANLVLNTYLKLAREDAHLSGLAAMPLFLSSRAAIRARVTASQLAHDTGAARARDAAAAARYFTAARAYLEPPAARLVAVGGLSGTGKTTLARALAPELGAAPGAVHVRSDVERKALHGVAETDRLPPEAYTKAAGEPVYARILEMAGAALAAGHSVIVDAVFSDPRERQAAEDAAARAGARFDGLWLDAPDEVMIARVTDRRGDASDADARVVRAQLARSCGTIGWHRLDAGGGADAVLNAARAVLG